MVSYCTPNKLPPPSDPTVIQYDNPTFAYFTFENVLVQNDSTVLSTPGFSFADVMKVMGISDLKKSINRTFQFATAWNRNSTNTDVSKAGILWKVNKHRESPKAFKPSDNFSDTYFIGFVSPVKGGGYANGTHAASNFTWQLTKQGIPVLMAATPYTAHVGFLNVFHYAQNYAVHNYQNNASFGYPNVEFKGTRIVGLDILSQENAENAQQQGVLGQFGMAKTSDGNVFLMYTDQGKYTVSANTSTTTFPVQQTGASYTVSVMHGEPIDTKRVHPADTNSKDESAQLYPTIQATNTVTSVDGMPTIVVDASVQNSYLRPTWSENILITEYNLTDYTISYDLSLCSYPGESPPFFQQSYTIPPGGSNVCFQLLMPDGPFTLSGDSSTNIVLQMPLRNYLQGGDYVGIPLPFTVGGCFNVLIRNTKTLGSNVYYYTDPSTVPAMSSTEMVYDELSVLPRPNITNTTEIALLVTAIAIVIIVISIVGWWFTKGKKAHELKRLNAAKAIVPAVVPGPKLPS